VHGEALHLMEHAALAKKLGVKDVVVCQNGDLVRLAPGRPGVIDEVPQGRLYKDGRLLVEAAGRTVAERRRLAYVGVVMVALAIDEKGALLADPDLELIGIPDVDAGGDSIATLAYDTVVETFENLPRPKRRDPMAVEEAITRAVRSAIANAWGKKPLCRVQVLVV
jgi:ribonuclease J